MFQRHVRAPVTPEPLADLPWPFLGAQLLSVARDPHIDLALKGCKDFTNVPPPLFNPVDDLVLARGCSKMFGSLPSLRLARLEAVPRRQVMW